MRGYDFVSIKTIVMTESCCFARMTTIDSWSVFRSVAEQSNIFFVFRGTNINAQKAPFNLSFRAWQVQPIVIRYLRSSSRRVGRESATAAVLAVEVEVEEASATTKYI